MHSRHLRALAEGVLAALDEAQPEIDRVHGRVPLGTHGARWANYDRQRGHPGGHRRASDRKPAVPGGTWTATSGFVPNDPPPIAVTVQPTQLRRPGRATIRTFVQIAIPVIFALAVVVPQVVQIILEETGDSLPEGFRTALLASSAVVVMVSPILAGIMAIPQVEALPRRYLPWLAAAPKS